MNQRPQDDVEALLRLAGKRPPVPAERAARVRDAARGAWLAEVRRRTRRRWGWTAAAAAAAAVVTLAVWIPGRIDRPAPLPFPAPVERLATIERIVGETRIGGEAGGTLPWGTEVRTLASGLASIRLPSGHAVRLRGDTSIVLSGPGVLDLRGGTVYIDSGSGPAGSDGVSVRSSLGEVTEIGTRFEVHVDEGVLRVRLRDGRVSIRAAGRTEIVEEGSEILIGADGDVRRSVLPPHGPSWDWLLDVTPVPDFEGKPVRVLLEWVARERGWSLAYADASIERRAETTILRGSLGELRPDDALDAALMASRLGSRLENGRLVVGTSTSTVDPHP